MSDPLSDITDSLGGPRAKVHRLAAEEGIDPELADDFLRVTGGIESGNRHRVRGKVLRSPAGALGFGQVLPDAKGGTVRTVGKRKYNLLDEDDNIRAGLAYFAEGGDDPVARRIGYLSGHHSGAVKKYKATGRIPAGGDPYTGVSFKEYVSASKGQDPLTELTRDPLTQASAPDPLSELSAPKPPPVRKSPFAGAKGGARGVPNLDTILQQARTRRAPSPTFPEVPVPMDEAERARAFPTPGIGELRQQDEPRVAQVLRIQQQVRAQQTAGQEALGRAPSTAQARMFDPHLNESEEVTRRLTAERDSEVAAREAESRQRELVASLTPEDISQLESAMVRMREQDPISRGIETGSQRVGSGLLYKLAGFVDLQAKLPASAGFLLPVEARKQFANYLRRQAGRGELTIDQIRQEMPPQFQEQAADFLTQALAVLPEIYAATQSLGMTAGFGALGGLEAGGRGGGPLAVGSATTQGMLLGEVFRGANALERPITPGMNALGQRLANLARSTPAVAAGTLAVESAFGASPREAALSTASNVAFHVGGRIPDLATTARENLRNRGIARSAQAQGATVLSAPGERPRLRIPTVGRERVEPTTTPTPAAEAATTAPGEWRVTESAAKRGKRWTATRDTPSGQQSITMKSRAKLEQAIAEISAPATGAPEPDILGEVARDVRTRMATTPPKPARVRQTPAVTPAPVPPPAEGATPSPAPEARSRMVDRWAARMKEGGVPESAVDAVVNSFHSGKQTRDEAIATFKLLGEEHRVAAPPPDHSTSQARRERTITTSEGAVRKPGEFFKKRGKKEGGFVRPPEIAEGLQDLYDRFGARHGTEPAEAESIIRGSLRPGSSISRQGGRDYEGYSVTLEFGEPARTSPYDSPYGPSAHPEAHKTTTRLRDIKRVMFDPESFVHREDAIEDYNRIRRALDETGRRNVPIEAAHYNEETDRFTYGGKVDFKRVGTFEENVARQGTKSLQRDLDEAQDSYIDALDRNDTKRMAKWEKRITAIESAQEKVAQQEAKDAKLAEFVRPKGPTTAPAEEVKLPSGKVSARRPREGGFLNITEVNAGLTALADRMPDASKRELRGALMREKPELFKYASTREKADWLAGTITGPTRQTREDLAKAAEFEEPTAATPVNARITKSDIAIQSEGRNRGAAPALLPEYARTFRAVGADFPKWSSARIHEWIASNRRDLFPVTERGLSPATGHEEGATDLGDVETARPPRATEAARKFARGEGHDHPPIKAAENARDLGFRIKVPSPGEFVVTQHGKELKRFSNGKDAIAFVAAEARSARFQSAEADITDLTDREIDAGQRGFTLKGVDLEKVPTDQLQRMWDKLAKSDAGFEFPKDAYEREYNHRMNARSDALRAELTKRGSDPMEKDVQDIMRRLQRRKKEGGFLNTGDIASAIADLRKRMPNIGEDELRRMVEKQATPEAMAAYMAQHARRLSSKGGSTLGSTDTEVSVSDDWKTIIRKVRARMEETGPIKSPGSGTYDVTKYPKGGKPDLAKIAWWIEPAVEKLWVDANRLTSQGKLKAVNLREHVREQLSDLIEREFRDWHVVNRKAALAVVNRRLSQIAGPTPDEAAKAKGTLEGRRKEFQRQVALWKSYDEMPTEQLAALAQKKFPEAYRTSPENAIDRLFRQIMPKVKKRKATTWHEETMNRLNALETALDAETAALATPEPTAAQQVAALKATAPPPPREADIDTGLSGGKKVRQLWEALAESGREAGTESGYEPETRAGWRASAEKLIREFGVEGAEEWYRQAKPGGIRPVVGRILGEYFQIRAATTNDPADLAKSIALANERVLGATEVGREVKAFDDPEYKLSLAGAMEEATRLYRQRVKDPLAQLPTPVAAKVNDAAVKRDKAQKKVRKLEAEVAAEPELPPRKVKIVKKSAQKPPPDDRSPAILGMGLGGVQSRFEVPPTVRAAQQRKAQAAKAFQVMQKKVGKYWTKASHPALERARIDYNQATRDLSLQLSALQKQNGNYFTRLGNTTRALMVSMFPTASRNAQTQVARSGVERITDAIEITLRKSVGLNSDLVMRDVWKNYTRQFDPSAKTFASEVLAQHPDELSRIFATYAGGVTIPQPNVLAKGVERIWGSIDNFAFHMNWANRTQEFHIRSAEFLAELELHTKKATGMTLEQFIARRGAEHLPPELIRRAVDKALEVTFAANPPQNTDMGKAMNWLIKLGNALPPTASPIPFPRFLYNSWKFLYQYNPIGGAANITHAGLTNRAISKRVTALRARTDLAPKERDQAITALVANRRNVPRAISQAVVGTAMLTVAYQIRRDPDLAGEKWYELKTPLGTVDTRPFGPFSTYLLFAEAIRRKRAGERGFSKREWLEGLGASTQPGGLSIATGERLFDYYEKGDYDKIGLMLSTELGDLGRAVFTPVRQVKDIIAQFDKSERITRDTKSRPITGPILESIPYASQVAGLPEAHRATSGRAVQQERPLLKFVTGYRVESPKNFVEHEIDRLHFRPQEVRHYTGNPTLDQAVNLHMGPLLDTESARLESDPRYTRASDAVKFAIMRKTLQSAYQSALSEAAQQYPDAFLQYRSRVPYWKQLLLDEAASPQ